jgi:hypothetical protein
MRQNTDPSRIPTASSAQHVDWIREEAAMAASAAALRHDSADDHSVTTAMQLTRPDLSQRQAPKTSTSAIENGERSRALPAQETAIVVARFQPLDPGIVNEAIPAFFIGRNMEGFWVARDVKGKIGGIFLLESSAVSFARRNSRPAGCATIFPPERFELDLENKGNPLVEPVGSLMRLVRRCWQRVAASIGKLTKRSYAG